MRKHLYIEVECDIDLIDGTWQLDSKWKFIERALEAAAKEIDNLAPTLDEELETELAAECPPVDDLRDMGLADYAYEGYRESRV